MISNIDLMQIFYNLSEVPNLFDSLKKINMNEVVTILSIYIFLLYIFYDANEFKCLNFNLSSVWFIRLTLINNDSTIYITYNVMCKYEIPIPR